MVQFGTMGCRLDSGLFITEICDYFLGNKLFVVGWTGLLATWERGMKKNNKPKLVRRHIGPVIHQNHLWLGGCFS